MEYITVCGEFGHILNINKSIYECRNNSGVYKLHCKALNDKTYSYVGYSDMVSGRIRSHLENFGFSYSSDKRLWNLLGAYKSPVKVTNNLYCVYFNPTFFNEWFIDIMDFDSDLSTDKYYLQEGRETDKSINNNEILLNVLSPPGSTKYVAGNNFRPPKCRSELTYDFKQHQIVKDVEFDLDIFTKKLLCL